MIPNLNDICTSCGGYGNQPILQLFDDKCFKIIDGKETIEDFCMKDFAYPVDGHSCVKLNVELSGGEITLFDNKIIPMSPAGILESGKLYARGVMVRIIYPTKDINGDELTFTDKSVIITMEDAETLTTSEYPLYDFFTIFTNAKSNKTKDLINKIKIVNPNTSYAIRVSALVIFGEAE